MKSSLKNMVVVLFSITLIASLCVGLVNKITFEPIEKAKAENIQTALKNVLPEFEASESEAMTVDELPVIVHTAKQGEQVVGYAVETMTTKGFSGVFRLMVGFRASGEVYNINVLEHSETPGLGSKMGDEGNSLLTSFKDKNPANMKQPLAVTKDGGDVQALTAATISSRAYVDAVVRAYNAVQQIKGGANVATGATSNSTEWTEGEQPAAEATETVNEETQKGEDNE
jgi:electron transport complex protein RnfG